MCFDSGSPSTYVPPPPPPSLPLRPDLAGAASLCISKAEIKTFDLRIGVVSHTLLSTKIRRGKVCTYVAAVDMQSTVDTAALVGFVEW